jgi:hypothetical protein
MSEQKYNGMSAGKDAITDFINDMRKIQESAQEPEQLDESVELDEAAKKSSLKYSRDVNGNKIVKVMTPAGSFSVQTNGNIPLMHREDKPSYSVESLEELLKYVMDHGTHHQMQLYKAFATYLPAEIRAAISKKKSDTVKSAEKDAMAGLANRNELPEETQLDEVSPPSEKSKKWLEDPKVQSAFKKQYGDDYKEVMFAKAWKDFKEEVEPNFELEMMDESAFRDYSGMNKKDMDDLAAERRRKRERGGNKDSWYNKDGSHKKTTMKEEEELDESFWYQDESDDELTEAEMFQKLGHKTYDGKVFVFYNINLSNKLGKPLWSIRNEKTGRIIGHDQGVVLRDAEFVVGQAGKEKVRDEKRKNVHAGVRGFIVHGETAQAGFGTAITYNPYKYDTFVSLPDETPVKSAKLVQMLDKKVGATGVGNYTEDELAELRGRAEKYKKVVNEDFNSDAAIDAIKKLAASGIEQEQLDEIFGLFKKKDETPEHEKPEQGTHDLIGDVPGLPKYENTDIGRFTFTIWKNKNTNEWYVSGINRYTMKQVAQIAPATSRSEAIKNARAAIAIEMNRKERDAKMASIAMESVQLEEETQPINKKSSGDVGFMAYWDKKRKLVAVYAKDAKEARELLMKHYKAKSIWDFSSVMPTEDEDGKQIVHDVGVLEAKEYSTSKEERLGKQFDAAMSGSLKVDSVDESGDWTPSMETVQVGRHTFVLWKHKSKNEWYGIAYLTLNGQTHKTLESANSKNAVVKALRASLKTGVDIKESIELEDGISPEEVISNLLEKYKASGKSIEALDQLDEMDIGEYKSSFAKKREQLAKAEKDLEEYGKMYKDAVKSGATKGELESIKNMIGEKEVTIKRLEKLVK